MKVLSPFYRVVAAVTAMTLTFQATADGLDSAVRATIPVVQRALQGPMPHFTQRPTAIFRGQNPGRDASRTSWWTPRLRQDWERGRTQQTVQNAIVRGDLLLSIDPSAGISFFQATPEGDGGGTAPGEGSGSSGGSGSGGSGTSNPPMVGGLSGETNTNTGNKLSTLPIVAWAGRGAVGVSLALFHNSVSSFSGVFGEGWSHSYEEALTYTAGSSAIIRQPDGLTVPFTESSGTFTPPAGVNDSLVHNTDGTWTLTTKGQAQKVYDVDGYLVAIKDRDLNTVTINRDAAHLVTSVVDPSGRTLTFAYTSGRVTSVTDPSGRVWSFTRDAAFDLTGITYPALGGVHYTRSFSYNAGHDILTETDLRGKVWIWTYDSSGKMLSHTNPLSQTTTYSYTSTATTITLPGGQITVHNYSSGLLASAVDSASFSAAYTYDSDRNILTTTDQRGKVWTNTYDANGNVLTSTDPLSNTTTFTYNATNDVLTATSPLGAVTTYAYTGGRLTSVTDALGRTAASYTYDVYGQVLTQADALGRTTTQVYNTNGDVTSVTDPAGLVTTRSYDTLGRALWVKDAGLNQTDFAYDEWGRLTTVTHPGGAFQTTAYDREGHVTSATDEISRTASWVYDDAGRLTSTTNGQGDTETYAYSLNGWQTSVTNGRGYTRTYTRTVRGEVASLTLPDGSVEQWSYDGAGNPTAYTNPLGQVIAYVFDNAGRQTTIDYPSGTDTTFAYDASGRRTSMVDATGTTTWTYNAGSEITQLVQPQGTLQYAYNSAGQQTTVTDVGNGTTTYTFDAGNGRLNSLTNAASQTTSFLYDTLGRVSRKTFSSGQYEVLSYDSRSRLTSVDVKNSSGTVLRSQTYTYDNASQVLTHTLAGKTTTYGYDGAGQLISESRPSTSYAATYTYDGNGNRLTRTVNGTTETYSYDAGDKLQTVSIGGTATKTYGYDAAGRTTSVASSAGTTTLVYDFEGRATSITGPGFSQSNVYNGLDTRVSKVDNSVGTTFLRNGADVVAPVVRDTNATYTPGISEVRGGTTRFLHSGLKNVDAQSTTSQTLGGTRRYDAFGNVDASTGSWSGPFGYGGGFGYQEEVTGLKLLGHRLYDSSTGRFITRDPVKDGRNWYVYCYSNPTSQVDPEGTIVWIPVILAVMVIIDIVDTANDINEIRKNPSDPVNYIGPAIGAIDPTPGNLGKRLFKRIPSKQLRALWEKVQGVPWPKDINGRNYDVSHKTALIDGGDNSIDNIEPLPRDEHIRRHIEAGDFKRWGGIRYE